MDARLTSHVLCAWVLLSISAVSPPASSAQHNAEAAIRTAAMNTLRHPAFAFVQGRSHVGLSGVYTIRHAHTNRFLDAHATFDRDFAAVTRPQQGNATQRWLLVSVGNGDYRIRQQSTGRYLDAHDTADRDFVVVTRPHQPNTSQHWIVRIQSDNTYRIQQRHRLQFLDAHDTANWDFGVVTRPFQPNATQLWIVQRAM